MSRQGQEGDEYKFHSACFHELSGKIKQRILMCWSTVRSLQIASSKDFYDLGVLKDQLCIKYINCLYNLANTYFINFLGLVLRVPESLRVHKPHAPVFPV